MKKFFPVNEPRLAGNEALYLEQCIQANEIAAGEFINKFEAEFANHLCTNCLKWNRCMRGSTICGWSESW